MAGLAEIVERDAFMRLWHDSVSVRDAAIWTSSGSGQGMREGCLVMAARYGMFMALSARSNTDGLPRFCIGLGCHWNPDKAATAARLERDQVAECLEAMLADPSVRNHARNLIAEPRKMLSPIDHALYHAMYGQPHRTWQRLFNNLQQSRPRRVHFDPYAVLEQAKAETPDLTLCDVTPKDVARIGFHVVKVIAPGLQPISFGFTNVRLGEGSPLAHLPDPLPSSWQPHPLG